MSKKYSTGEVTRRKIHLAQLLKEMDTLKEKGQENYSPKIGRQLKKIEKEVKTLQPNIEQKKS